MKWVTSAAPTVMAGIRRSPGVLLNLFEGPRLLVFRAGDRITLTARRPSRVMFLGGAAMEGPRHIWWNFVSSSKERIEQAKEDWKTGRFDPVPRETEFIPLPE
jgi:redox-sensitive bicupin YhaK (pirin superfamily)